MIASLIMQAGEEQVQVEAEDKNTKVAPEEQPETGTDPRQAGEGSKEHSADKADAKREKKKNKTDSAAKLAFLEKKYKEVFTENNIRKEELGKLASLVQDFLREIDVEVKCQDYEVGDVTAYRTAFVDGWVRFRKKAEVDKRRAEDDFKAKEKALQEEIAKEKAEGNSKRETGAKEAKAAADKTIKNLEELNIKLQTDNNNLLALLKTKEGEIAEVRQANLALSNKAADSLMDRFEKMGGDDFSLKIEHSSQVDEIIRLKNELDDAHEMIDKLENQITLIQKRKQSNDSSSMKENEGSPKDFQIDRKTISISTQTDESQQMSPYARFKGNYQNSIGSPYGTKYERLEDKLEKEVKEKKQEEEETSKTYLKSLMVRYLIFEAKKNDSECNVLRRAILDYLQVSTEERATIDDAINNRGGLKDSIYFLRIFGGST